MKIRKIKNPCSICGRRTDTQGWCGSSDHDDGNPFGGINCLVIFPKQANKEIPKKRATIKKGKNETINNG